MKLTLLLYALAMVRYPAHAVGSARRMPRVVQSSRRHQQQSRPSTQNCTWKYYTQPLSHFSEGSTVNGNASFSQRVCIIDRYWKAPSVAMLGAGAGGVQGAGQQLKGPILFYTGNESPIDEYVNNTGLMWSLAPKLGALLVFLIAIVLIVATLVDRRRHAQLPQPLHERRGPRRLCQRGHHGEG